MAARWSASVATSENWKDRDGERKEKTEWHNVSIFYENLGRVAESYLKKGSKVYLEGQLETRKWQDQSGNDRYSTDSSCRIQQLDGPARRAVKAAAAAAMAAAASYDDDFGGGGGGGGFSRPQSRPQPAAFDTDLDDDVPF